MSWLAVAVAALVVAGAVVALSARDPRIGIVGLAAALALAPLAADPLPDPLAVAARILAAALATYLVLVPIREAPLGPAQRPAWPAEAFAGAALFVAGAAAHVTLLGGTGSQASTAAAVSLAGLAAVPLVDRSDGPRTAFAVLLAVAAADLAWVGLVGPPTAFEALVVAAVMVAVAAAASVEVAGPRPGRDRRAMADPEPPTDGDRSEDPADGEPAEPGGWRDGWRLPRPSVGRPDLGGVGERLGRLRDGLGGFRRGRDDEPAP